MLARAARRVAATPLASSARRAARLLARARPPHGVEAVALKAESKASPPLSSSRRRARELRGEAALEAREERDARREVGGHPPSSHAAQASLGASAA